MKENLKGTRNFYVKTGCHNGRGVLMLYRTDTVYLVVFVYKDNRNKLTVWESDLRGTNKYIKAIALFINEYCAIPYTEPFKGNTLSRPVFIKFLNDNYGFDFKYNKTKKIKNLLQKELTGLET
jgi:fido (protein-threonine AMPylation protein)